MNSALIIHGTPDEEEYYSADYPSCANSHWLPWLQKQLLMQDLHAETPEMPRAYWPDYKLWKNTFEQYQRADDCILVGHSCGGGFLLRYLSEHGVNAKRVILVAPWLDPDQSKDPSFFDFEPDSSIAEKTDLHMIVSDNDMPSIDKSVSIIEKEIPGIQSHLFAGYGHFTNNDMGTTEFPELRDLALHGRF